MRGRREIVFTGGATEATNIAIRGAVVLDSSRMGIVTTNIERSATDVCCHLLERAGHPVEQVPASRSGIVTSDRVAAMVGQGTAVVTVVHAQNEIGTIQPVSEIARAARTRGVLVHTDAAQSVGKIPVRVKELGADLLTIAGHKLHAPKGIGALFVRKGVRLPPLLVGAGQERGLRPGTENVACIVGLGVACAVARRTLEASRTRIAKLSATFLELLRCDVPGLVLVGDRERRPPNTLNVCFPAVSGRKLLDARPQVLASTGSACHADSEEPSAILNALGLSRTAAGDALILTKPVGVDAAGVRRLDLRVFLAVARISSARIVVDRSTSPPQKERRETGRDRKIPPNAGRA